MFIQILIKFILQRNSIDYIAMRMSTFIKLYLRIVLIYILFIVFINLCYSRSVNIFK